MVSQFMLVFPRTWPNSIPENKRDMVSFKCVFGITQMVKSSTSWGLFEKYALKVNLSPVTVSSQGAYFIIFNYC